MSAGAARLNALVFVAMWCLMPVLGIKRGHSALWVVVSVLSVLWALQVSAAYAFPETRRKPQLRTVGMWATYYLYAALQFAAWMSITDAWVSGAPYLAMGLSVVLLPLSMVWFVSVTTEGQSVCG